jgi:hypothetical protein
LAAFEQLKKYTEEEIHSISVSNSKTTDHTNSLDHYIDKYLPVTIQNMISDSLGASLIGDQRRNDELYEASKLGMLYKSMLEEDEGKRSGIIDEIFRLNERAKDAIAQ